MKRFAFLLAFGGMMLFAGNVLACPCHEQKNNEPSQAEASHCQHADQGCNCAKDGKACNCGQNGESCSCGKDGASCGCGKEGEACHCGGNCGCQHHHH